MNTSPARTIVRHPGPDALDRAALRARPAPSRRTRTPSAAASSGCISTHASGASPSRIGDPAGLRAGVPVLDRAAGVEQQRELGRGRVADRLRLDGAAPRARPSGSVEAAVGVEAGRAAERRRRRRRRARPLHAAGRVDALPGDAAVVARPAGRHPPPLLERVRAARVHPANSSSAQPQRSATARKMSKSVRASPGGSTAARTRDTRRSLFVNVPSFSPQIAAGSTTSASAVVGVSKPSCTTSRSSGASANSSTSRFGNDTTGLVPMTHRPLICPTRPR